MGRIETRDALFKLVFEYSLLKEKNEDFLNEFIEDKKIDDRYLSNCYNGIINNYDELVSEIGKFTKGYTIERVYKVDLALLVVALYEIKYVPEIPVAVSINEALNLAKIYSTEKSVSFINGVLKNFAKVEN